MIKNIWNIVRFYCMNNHEKPVKMHFVQGEHSFYYACPECNPETKENDKCLSFEDAEKIVTQFSKIVEKDNANNIMTNLTNFRWKYKNMEVIILKHMDEKIKIGIKER